MKKILIYFLVVNFCMIHSSCEDNLMQEHSEQTSDLIQTRNDNDIILERRLQWVSFISAKVLKNHEDARLYFLNKLGQESIISIDSLIGIEVQSQNPFYDNFYNYLLDYLHKDYIDFGSISNIFPQPDYEKDKPRRPIMNSGLANHEANNYIQYITDLNCVELFIPNLLSFPQEGFKITSVAHPLYESYLNKGYKRYFRLADNTNSHSITECANIDQFYVSNNDNIVIARPLRTEGFMNCDYLEYQVSDFTEFLNPN